MMPFRVVGVGDIMLGRGVDASAFDQYGSLLSNKVISALSGDIVTGNLECVLGKVGQPNPLSHSHFRGDPGKAAPLLKQFNFLSLANNHINDFGSQAIQQTMIELDQLGIRYAGVGKTIGEAHEPAVFEVAGATVAIFAATTVSPLQPHGEFVAAEPGRRLNQQLAFWKSKGAHCILHLHTGGGDFEQPAPFVTDLMRKISLTSVDVIFAHHPHIVQGRETINQTHIFYSMGDFVFDKTESGRDIALIAHIDFHANCFTPVSIKTIPVKRSRDLQIDLLAGKELEAFDQRLKSLDAMIENGLSGAAYDAAIGNPFQLVISGTINDFRAGGWRAILAKIRRLDRHRLSFITRPIQRMLRINRRNR